MTKNVLFGVALLIASAGCAQKQIEPSRPAYRNEAASIAQVGYGLAAKYVTCPLSGCSQPTPKTLVAQQNTLEEALAKLPPVVAVPSPAASAALPVVGLPVPPAASSPPVVEPMLAKAPSVVAPLSPPAVVVPVAQATVPAHPDFVETSSSNGHQRVFIGFPSGSARLTKEAKSRLNVLVPRVLGAERVVIKGRTDERGRADSNDRLALRRAMAVYDHLRRAAKATNTPFKLLAKGACCYIARNITEDGRAANRRAEIDFVLPVQAAVSPSHRTPTKDQPS